MKPSLLITYPRIANLSPMLLLAAAVPLLAGCQSQSRTVSVKDSLDPDGDEIRLFEGPPEEDQVHQPYVIGAEIRLIAESSDPDDHPCDWTMRSRDPEVFKVVSQRGCGVDFRAVGVGKTVVDVFEPGSSEPVDQVNIKVGRPDHVVLLDAADEMSHHGELAETEQVNLLQGASSWDSSAVMFVVRAYNHETRLYGTGAVHVNEDSGHFSVVKRTTSLNSNEDWIGFYAADAGTKSTLQIKVGDIAMQPIEVVIHPREDIAHVQLVDDGSPFSEAGDNRKVVVVAHDAQGHRLHGAGVRWWLDGEDNGGGDMFAYQYDPDTKAKLSAYMGEDEVATLQVRASSGAGERAGTHVAACSYAPGGKGGVGTFAWIVSALGLGAFIQRRRRR